MPLKWIFIFLISVSSLACSSFSSRVGDFRGPGDLRPVAPPPAHRVTGPFSLIWPVPKIRITQEFRPSKNRSHQGLDLGGRRNSDILAAHEGRVIYTGNGFTGYGNMVMIERDDAWATLYAHLHSTDVEEGQWVRQGQRIGGMGRTGRATGVHLHFELLQNKQPIDPLNFLQGSERLATQDR